MGFKNTVPSSCPNWWEICPAAWMSGFLGSRPYRWLTASPRLASVSLACYVDTPHLLCRVLIGVRSFELLRWKRLGKQHPIIIPSKVRRGSRGWLLHTVPATGASSKPISVLAAQTGSKAQSSPYRCLFRIDFPKLNYSTAQTISVLSSPWWFSNALQVSILLTGYKKEKKILWILSVTFQH